MYNSDSMDMIETHAQFYLLYPIHYFCFKMESRTRFIGIRSHAKQGKILNPWKKFLILICTNEFFSDWHNAIE